MREPPPSTSSKKLAVGERNDNILGLTFDSWPHTAARAGSLIGNADLCCRKLLVFQH
jgi:hypothetical protein